ncbi:hypothetical protein [Metasolibacillus fluoroglycofenilyticus]|uniref:hypothetical protein n=1 Tax=Metasolibacillus fluoroglycofenilyticus TaxID=1239396 RepID=UPI000D3A1226|nr:hypothetical protein [Metasolibacillus fluoroglycofenilyticus]
MLKTEYTIDNLTMNGVSIKTQRYYETFPLGEPHRKAYMNSDNGRIELQSEVPQAQVNAVFAVWGDTPTTDDAITD